MKPPHPGERAAAAIPRLGVLAVAAAPLLGVLAIAAAPGVAAADPGFPDLSAYPAVDAVDYLQSYPYFSGFAFETPDGLRCAHNELNSRDDPSRSTLSCEGPRPDRGPGTWQVLVATDEAAVAEPSYPPLDPAIPTDPATAPRTLPALHKIVYAGIECAADDRGMTACRIGEHGFVLTPTSTELF
ncbi:hypothetical protein JDV09_18685 [Mycobacterium sp. Y57]|uniref:hypothetical protein n=1 Tax=Mycolicibacterium xanthum TaxID=2796469 RepID=UPI001C856C25|nr:hypothetical protein [Mycolicibacterium xanthum]MBX7434126.1 hypothetical protein [Mycolicibacterium xanthum]